MADRFDDRNRRRWEEDDERNRMRDFDRRRFGSYRGPYGREGYLGSSDYDRGYGTGGYYGSDYDRETGYGRREYGRFGYGERGGGYGSPRRFRAGSGPEEDWDEGFGGGQGGRFGGGYGGDYFDEQRRYGGYGRQGSMGRYEQAYGRENLGRPRGGSGREFGREFGRDFGGESDWRGGYGQSGRSSQGYAQEEWGSGYGQDIGDFEPSWTYTELWYIPGPFTGQGPSNYQRSDERIMEDVCERLTHHGQIDASEMQVEIDNGIVILRGEVHDRRSKRMAEDTIESVPGVQDVRNELRVQQQQKQQEHRQKSGEDKS